MKILELTNYTAGGCGVWARVKNEAELLSKRGYDVRIFSSNFIDLIVFLTNDDIPFYVQEILIYHLADFCIM